MNKNKIIKNFKKLFLLLFLLVLPFSLSSCKFKWNKSDVSTFDDYTTSLFASVLGNDEFTLHWLLKQQEDFGFNEHGNVSLPTPSNPSILSSVAINYLFGKVESYDYNELNFDQKMTYNVISDLLLNYNSKTPEMSYLSNNYLGSYLGYQAQLPLLLSEYKFYDESDIEYYFKFMDIVPETFKQYVDYEYKKADKGYGMPDYVIDKVINQCVEFVKESSDHFLIKTFDARIDNLNLTNEKKIYYIEENIKRVTGSLCDGYKYVRDNLGALKGKATNNLGLAHYDIGKAYYRIKFRDATGYDISIEDAIAYVDTKLNSCIAELRALINSDPELVNKLEKTTLMNITPKEQLELYKDEIINHFPAIEKYPNINVKYIDPSMENHFSPAAYMTSPLDDYTDEYIYLNNAKINGDYNYLYTTLAHEGIPGHMYQNIYFKTLNVNPLRKVLKNSGYTEGWATYAEIYSYNFCKDFDQNVIKYLKLNDLINGILTARLDIGIHYEGWTIDNLLSFLSNYFKGYTYEKAQKIFEQLVEVPTNSQMYYFTYFKINDMYEKAKTSLKDNFNEIEFHKLLLDCGPVPLRYVEIVVDEYISNHKN